MLEDIPNSKKYMTQKMRKNFSRKCTPFPRQSSDSQSSLKSISSMTNIILCIFKLLFGSTCFAINLPYEFSKRLFLKKTSLKKISSQQGLAMVIRGKNILKALKHRPARKIISSWSIIIQKTNL